MVRTKDAYGNDRGMGGDTVGATLVQVATEQVIHAAVTDSGDGTYTLHYKLRITSGGAAA